MAISKKSKESKSEASFEVKVTRAKDFSKDGQTSIAFDMEVNGVTIYGCYYREGKSAAGKDYEMISFPSKKAADGKYYNHAYFHISDELLQDIEKQIEAVL